jgi:hypothetical protein
MGQRGRLKPSHHAGHYMQQQPTTIWMWQGCWLSRGLMWIGWMLCRNQHSGMQWSRCDNP